MGFLTLNDLSSFSLTEYTYVILRNLINKGVNLSPQFPWDKLPRRNLDNLVELIDLTKQSNYTVTGTTSM